MRCYDGCPDDELKAILDDAAKAREELTAVGLWPTYFPAEGKWMVFDKDHRPVTDFCDSLRGAANAAMEAK